MAEVAPIPVSAAGWCRKEFGAWTVAPVLGQNVLPDLKTCAVVFSTEVTCALLGLGLGGRILRLVRLCLSRCWRTRGLGVCPGLSGYSWYRCRLGFCPGLNRWCQWGPGGHRVFLSRVAYQSLIRVGLVPALEAFVVIVFGGLVGGPGLT